MNRLNLPSTGLCFVVAIIIFFSEAVAQIPDSPTAPELISVPKAGKTPTGMWSQFGNTLIVSVVVDEKGRVQTVNGVDGPGATCPGANIPEITKLREAAAALAMKARFKPAKLGDKPVPSSATVEIVFPLLKVGEDPAAPNARAVRGSESDSRTVKTIKGDTEPNPDSVPVRLVRPDGETNEGVLNQKAALLSKPTYPAAAKAVRATGTVRVQVLIGEDGTMASAEPISGHPLLRSAARTAACSSKFTPTLLSGSPVKVAGIITYNFVP